MELSDSMAKGLINPWEDPLDCQVPMREHQRKFEQKEDHTFVENLGGLNMRGSGGIVAHP